MSMSICDVKKALCAGLILLLGACVEQQGAGMAGGEISRSEVEIRSVVLERSGNAVTIAAPQGYCIDPQVAHEGAVVMGGCAAMGVEAPLPAGDASETLVMMTASVADAAIPGDGHLAARAARLERALQSERIAGLLAEHRGEARLIETRLHGDTVYALVEDNEATAFDGADRRFWRAMSEENNRMVILTVRALEMFWPGEQALLERAIALRESIRAANTGPV